MKKFFQFLALSLMMVVAVACSQGSAAINKAFDEACQAQSAEKVATTLCNGHIKCSTLTPDEAAKLGAVLGYITFTGMYSANFNAQVDMHEFGKLLDEYKALQLRQDGTDKQLIEEYTKQIFSTRTLE
ncbi:MAG: hypothetical protein J1F43_01205 [Muribaculaceae bacterium]|nr:hypothetical protein [Muribaculaceae bacterium]